MEISGIIPALLTPFSEDGARVREDVLTGLVQDLAEQGASAVLTCGGTGEFTSLSGAERCRVTEVVVRALEGSIPVVAHTGAMSTAETIELSLHAEQAGATAVMVFTPYVGSPSWAEVYRHYEAVAEAVTVPVVAYHRANARLTVAQLRELARIDRIKYLKESSGDGVFLNELVQRGLPGCEVLVGWESLTFFGFAAGLRGTMSAAANYMLAPMVELLDVLVDKKDLDEGRRLWDRLWPPIDFLERKGFVQIVKAACASQGYMVGPPRAPLLPLREEDRVRLEQLLDALRTTA